MPIIHKLFGIEDRESEIFMKKEVFIGECKLGEGNIVEIHILEIL